MRLRIYSDLHLEFAPFDPPAEGADVIILAGDIHVGVRGVDWALEAFPNTPVLYVPGNHEYYRETIPDLTEELVAYSEGTHVHVLDQAAAIVNGVRFLGCTLWTDLALYGDAALGGAAIGRMMSDFQVIRVAPRGRKLYPSDTARFHKDSVKWLREAASEGDEPLVVISHHAPSPQSLDPRYGNHPSNAGYASRLEPLIEEISPLLWVHGHIHRPVHYQVGNTTVFSNPRGYPNETGTAFQPDLLLELNL